MDINNIALIVITAFINLAVSSIVFYRYQKKIESTFAKSMLEYQTKYVRNHEKAVETLETIYKQFSDIASSMQDISLKIFETTGIFPDDKKHVPYRDIDSLNQRYIQLNLYILNHEIYLPDNIKDSVSNIIGRSLTIHASIHTLFNYYKNRNRESFDFLVESFHINIKKLDKKKPNEDEETEIMNVVCNKIDDDIFGLLRELELIYKSYVKIEQK